MKALKDANLPHEEINISVVHSKGEVKHISNEQTVIIFSLEGNLQVMHKSDRFEVKEGDGLLLKQTVDIHYRTLSDQYEGIVCVLDTNYLGKVLSKLLMPTHYQLPRLGFEGICIPRSEMMDQYTYTLKTYLSYANERGNGWKFISESKLIELVWLLMHSEVKEKFQALIFELQRQGRNQFDSILEKYYKENLTIEKLAQLAGFSVSTFKRKFECIYNNTPGKWIQNRRLEEAQYLLIVSDKTVSEICYEVGFENPSHFIQLFKIKYGTTPRKMKISRLAS